MQSIRTRWSGFAILLVACNVGDAIIVGPDASEWEGGSSDATAGDVGSSSQNDASQKNDVTLDSGDASDVAVDHKNAVDADASADADAGVDGSPDVADAAIDGSDGASSTDASDASDATTDGSVMTLVTTAPGSTQPTSGTIERPLLSSQGRYIAFLSTAPNLVSSGNNSAADAFQYDRTANTTTLISKATTGGSANADARHLHMPATGDYAVFASTATNLVTGDTNGQEDVFLWTRSTGMMERVSVDLQGVQGNGYSNHPSVSNDGRYVAFVTKATNLASSPSTYAEVYIRDRQANSTDRISLTPNGDSDTPMLSGSGRYLVFASKSSNYVTGDNNGKLDIFRKDFIMHALERVSLGVGGVEPNEDCEAPIITGNGRYVSFVSFASNLTTDDVLNTRDLFVVDMGITPHPITRFSLGAAAGEKVAGMMSDDGRWLVASTTSSLGKTFDTNGKSDVFLWDITLPTQAPIVISSIGQMTIGNGTSAWASISESGTFVAFSSDATNLTATDTNGSVQDLFLLQRW